MCVNHKAVKNKFRVKFLTWERVLKLGRTCFCYCCVLSGFSFCPDICSEELEKLSHVVELLGKVWYFLHNTHLLFLLEKRYGENIVQPVYISVDPQRDTVAQIAAYRRGTKSSTPKAANTHWHSSLWFGRFNLTTEVIHIPYIKILFFVYYGNRFPFALCRFSSEPPCVDGNTGRH